MIKDRYEYFDMVRYICIKGKLHYYQSVMRRRLNGVCDREKLYYQGKYLHIKDNDKVLLECLSELEHSNILTKTFVKRQCNDEACWDVYDLILLKNHNLQEFVNIVNKHAKNISFASSIGELTVDEVLTYFERYEDDEFSIPYY